jgi:hypothetical protein
MNNFCKRVVHRVLPILNVILFVGLVLMGLKEKNSASMVDAEKITLQSPDQKERIEIGFFEKHPEIRFLNEKGNVTLALKGGSESEVSLYNSQGATLASLLVNGGQEAEIMLYDDNRANRMEIKGGSLPAIYLKNPTETVVGSWSLFQEGGCGFGLAQADGMVSTILRGGDKPGLALYDQSDLPGAVFGLLEKVPHLLIAGSGGEEGILIHGGKPSGLMVMDENGQLKIFISKHGIYQGKEKSSMDQPKEKQKLFTFDGELKTLFPKKGKNR